MTHVLNVKKIVLILITTWYMVQQFVAINALMANILM